MPPGPSRLKVYETFETLLRTTGDGVAIQADDFIAFMANDVTMFGLYGVEMKRMLDDTVAIYEALRTPARQQRSHADDPVQMTKMAQVIEMRWGVEALEHIPLCVYSDIVAWPEGTFEWAEIVQWINLAMVLRLQGDGSDEKYPLQLDWENVWRKGGLLDAAPSDMRSEEAVSHKRPPGHVHSRRLREHDLAYHPRTGFLYGKQHLETNEYRLPTGPYVDPAKRTPEPPKRRSKKAKKKRSMAQDGLRDGISGSTQPTAVRPNKRHRIDTLPNRSRGLLESDRCDESDSVTTSPNHDNSIVSEWNSSSNMYPDDCSSPDSLESENTAKMPYSDPDIVDDYSDDLDAAQDGASGIQSVIEEADNPAIGRDDQERLTKAMRDLQGSNWLGEETIMLVISLFMPITGIRLVDVGKVPEDGEWDTWASSKSKAIRLRESDAIVLVPLFDSKLRHWRLLSYRIGPETITVVVYDSIAGRVHLESLRPAIWAISQFLGISPQKQLDPYLDPTVSKM